MVTQEQVQIAHTRFDKARKAYKEALAEYQESIIEWDNVSQQYCNQKFSNKGATKCQSL